VWFTPSHLQSGLALEPDCSSDGGCIVSAPETGMSGSRDGRVSVGNRMGRHAVHGFQSE
jgi:hypothetical protein